MDKNVENAIYNGDISKLQKHLSVDNVEATDPDGYTPLMLAVLSELGAVAVPHILAIGADPNYTEKRGFSALHFAARDGKPDLVKQLIAAGAHGDEKDHLGCTPLWHAVRNNAPIEVIKHLIGAGADPDAKDSSNDSSPRSLAEMFESDEILAVMKT